VHPSAHRVGAPNATLRSTSTAVKLFPGAAIELFQPCRWPVWQLYRLASCLRADQEDAASDLAPSDPADPSLSAPVPNLDESIEELRQIADDRDDIWPRPPGLPWALGMPAQPPTSFMS
jgi:hypothetical protein